MKVAAAGCNEPWSPLLLGPWLLSQTSWDSSTCYIFFSFADPETQLYQCTLMWTSLEDWLLICPSSLLCCFFLISTTSVLEPLLYLNRFPWWPHLVSHLEIPSMSWWLSSMYLQPGILPWTSDSHTQMPLKGTEVLPPWSCFFGDIGFNLFIKKQDSERTFDSPPFLAQEIQTEKPASGGKS